MEKASTEGGQAGQPRFERASINREHLGQRLFSSKAWITYCVLQILASVCLIAFVAVDLEEK